MRGDVLSVTDGLTDARNGRADGVNEQFGFNLRRWNTGIRLLDAPVSARKFAFLMPHGRLRFPHPSADYLFLFQSRTSSPAIASTLNNCIYYSPVSVLNLSNSRMFLYSEELYPCCRCYSIFSLLYPDFIFGTVET